MRGVGCLNLNLGRRGSYPWKERGEGVWYGCYFILVRECWSFFPAVRVRSVLCTFVLFCVYYGFSFLLSLHARVKWNGDGGVAD